MLLTSLFYVMWLTISFIYSNIFILVSEYVYLLYKFVFLANTSRKNHLPQGLSHSRVCGQSPTCLPLVNISIPLLPFRGLRDLRVHCFLFKRAQNIFKSSCKFGYFPVHTYCCARTVGIQNLQMCSNSSK
jgi:hypothetical protein